MANASVAFKSLTVPHGAVIANGPDVPVSLAPSVVGLCLIAFFVALLLLHLTDPAAGCVDLPLAALAPISLISLAYVLHVIEPGLPFGPGGSYHWALVIAAIFVALLPRRGSDAYVTRTHLTLVLANLASAASIAAVGTASTKDDCGFALIGPALSVLTLFLAAFQIRTVTRHWGGPSFSDDEQTRLEAYITLTLALSVGGALNVFGHRCIGDVAPNVEAWAMLGIDVLIVLQFKELLLPSDSYSSSEL